MDKFENRKFVVLAIMILIGIIFLGRLFYIQVIDESYKLSAENQALVRKTLYPSRGVIYDRNGEVIVYNQASYDLMVTPKLVDEDIDTATFCNILGITIEDYKTKMAKCKRYSRYRASIFEKQITDKNWVSISGKLFQYPGFFGQKRTLRKYARPVAAQVLGFVGEASRENIDKDPFYRPGDYLGISGLETWYEKELRGKRGVKVYKRDVHNRIMGSYADGRLDTLPVAGQDLISTLDLDLQEYGEKLMRNKRGSIVAIEPATGEILALVSSPNYDPNMLVGRARTENYSALVANDSLNPLFNRALNAVYRPGSIFKLVQSLIGLQTNVIKESTRVRCNRAIINCHGAHTNDDLYGAIQHSCNPYFREVYRRLIQGGEYANIYKDSRFGLGVWRDYVTSFGLGVRLQTDISGVGKGFVPDVAFYDKWYGELRWAFSTIYSNSIGEGEMGVTPLQMANLAAILANRGFYYTPHFIKSIGETGPREEYLKKNYTKIDSSYFYVVIDALAAVVNEPSGTARRARMDSIIVCGKTGTVQNPTTPDHSVFMAFAPKDDPKIAIAVYVEEAGFGGTWAAPISSLMIEKFINGEVVRSKKEQRILDADFLIPVKKKDESH
ncbi:MAG: peptidoglycan D,D-transpeptidase FtsI family protein [Salibacteraceae bacterium]